MTNRFNQEDSYNSQNGSQNGKYGDRFRQEGNTAQNSVENELTLRWLIAQLWFYKWTLLLFVLGFGLISFIWAQSIQPIYEANGTLLINESKNRYSYAGSDLSNLLTTSYGLGVGSSFVNQLEIIRSRKIAQEIADRVYQDPIMSNGKRYPILWADYPEDSTSINREQLVNRIKGKLKVRRIENNADLAKVFFESYSPVEAAMMVNLIMDTYTEVSTEQNRQSARSARQFLDTQRNKITKELKGSEEALKNFQEKTGLVAAVSQTGNDFNKLSQLDQKKQEQQIKLFSLNTAIENYQAELEKIKPDFAENFAKNIAPILSKLQGKLSDLEAQRIVLISKNPGLEDNPGREPQMVDLNTQINALKANIRTQANAILTTDSTGFISGEEGTQRLAQLRQNLVQARIEKAQAQSQISVIKQMQADEEAQMDRVPRQMLQLARLKRDLSMKESLFETISQQYAETSLWEQTQSGAGSPLDYATVPHQPVAPDLFIYVIAGLLLGSVAGVGYIVFKVETNTTIDTPARLAEIPYPLLSVIPDFTREEAYKTYASAREGQDNINKNWIALYASNSSSAEAFRRLQNNILYSQPDKELKTLMITSSEQGEGKTSVSLNLATTLTEAGKKVLVIDSDLRRPNLHKLSNLKKQPGLMDVIFEGKSLEASIQGSRHENLSVLSVGKRPPNPSAVLRSNKMAQMMKKLENKYDYILLDTPPLGIVGDAAPLIRYADGVIVVAKFGETEIGKVKKLVDELEHLHAPILGTVLTSFKPEKSAYGYYHNSKYSYNYRSYEEYVEQT